MMSTRDSQTPDDIRELKHANNERLRNAFEEIFDKYAHDFGNVGDEVDLVTGEIVVNNGHIERMRHEQDTGFRAPTLVRDWTQDVQVQESETRNKQQSSVSDDDLWEDIVDEEQDQEERDVDQDVDDALMDELASNDRDFADARQSRSIPPETENEPDIRRERLPPVSPASHQQRSFPSFDMPLQPPFDRKIVQAFADNISNQITDFIMYMASSIQQQVSNPSLSSLIPNQQRTNYSEFAEFENPPSKRRRFGSEPDDGTQRTEFSQPPNTSQNPLLKSRLQRLRTDPKGHAHRGRTPGMPSLWSEDETDYYSKKKRRKTAKSGSKNSQFSALRHEISIPDETLSPASRREQRVALGTTTIARDGASSDDSDELFVSSRVIPPGGSQENGQIHRLPKDGQGTKPMVSKKTYSKRLKKPFSTKDDIRMIGLYYKGLNWEEISTHFPGTSKSQIRYHFQKHLADGDTQTYEPRPNIFTPPESPTMSGSEEPKQEINPRTKSKPKSKSVTFATNVTPFTFSNPAVPNYSLQTHVEPQQSHNHAHYTGQVPGMTQNMYSGAITYGSPVNTVAIDPALPNIRAYEYVNEESEPIQFLQIPAAGPTS